MADKLRKKHEPLGRRRLLRGHTGRYNDRYRNDEQVKPILEGGNRNYLTAVDLVCGHLGGTLNKRRGWEEVPALLERESVTPPAERVKWWPYSETTYKLKAQVVVKEKHQKHPNKQDESTIYRYPGTKVRVPHKVFTRRSTETPANVYGQRLSWKWRNRPQLWCYRTQRERPDVHGALHWSVVDGPFLPHKHERSYLEIDFGQTKTVTAVSTQGSVTAFRQYPSVRFDYERKVWIVEGNFQDSQYNGQYWNVIEPSEISNLRWVRSYELFGRSEGGREWTSFGIFRGNNDSTTEVAHAFPFPGVVCRYLRFVPLECENGGAMRLAVYGENGDDCCAKRCAQHDAVDTDEDLVEYTLTRPRQQSAFGVLDRDSLGMGCSARWYKEEKKYRNGRVNSRRCKKMKEQADDEY